MAQMKIKANSTDKKEEMEWNPKEKVNIRTYDSNFTNRIFFRDRHALYKINGTVKSKRTCFNSSRNVHDFAFASKLC